MENVHFRNFWPAEDATKLVLRDIFSPLARNGKRVTVTSTYPRMTLVTGLTSRYIQKFANLDQWLIMSISKLRQQKFLNHPLDAKNLI